jgi:hypothetical protein
MRKAAQGNWKDDCIGAYILKNNLRAGKPILIRIEQWSTTQAANKPDYYVIHSYYTPYQQNSSADVILPLQVTTPLQ